MSTSQHQLERGKALVIVGPQGSGKNVLARSLARQYGKLQEITSGVIFFDSQLRHALAGRISTLIIDGEPFRDELAQLKSMLTSTTTRIRVPYTQVVKKVPTPHLIFCSDSADWLGADNGRRFTVVHADKRGR